MRCFKVFFAALTGLMFSASCGLAQSDHGYMSTQGECQGQNCYIYGGCAPTESTTGCACQQGNCHRRHTSLWSRDRDYFAYEPILPCPGDRVNSILELQKLNGRIAQLVFRSFHFEWNSQQQVWQLSRAGRTHVSELVRILPGTPGSIQISPSGNPAMDQIRFQLLQDAFLNTGTGVMPQFTVQTPVDSGLYGIEASKIFEQRQLGSPLSQINSGQGTSGLQASPTGISPSR